MTATNPHHPSSIFLARASALFEAMRRQGSGRRFAINLADGTKIPFGEPPEFEVSIADQQTLEALATTLDPSTFAEAYLDRRVDVRGDLEAAIELASALGRCAGPEEATPPPPPPQRHTRERDAADVRTHYDLSNDFFRLFLDEKMVYSCAYFSRPEEPLEVAQARKLDLVCRKLRLTPGDQLLDLGCGWGALALWAASRYGVEVVGTTLSAEQAAEAHRRVEAAGLRDRVRIEVCDYRDLVGSRATAPSRPRFDKIASIGMYEHVGVENYAEYFGTLLRLLKPKGILLNHGITSTQRRIGRTGAEFIRRHVFPGAELAPLSAAIGSAEDAGFEVLDVQSLRPHYTLTLRSWSRRFRAHREEAAKLVPERTLRTWDLYLPGCAQAFSMGIANVYQVVAAIRGSGEGPLPLRREAWLGQDQLLSAQVFADELTGRRAQPSTPSST